MAKREMIGTPRVQVQAWKVGKVSMKNIESLAFSDSQVFRCVIWRTRCGVRMSRCLSGSSASKLIKHVRDLVDRLKPPAILSLKLGEEEFIPNNVEIPKIISWEEYVPQGSNQWESQIALSRLFDERPIWSKNSLAERLLNNDLRFTHSMVRGCCLEYPITLKETQFLRRILADGEHVHLSLVNFYFYITLV
ncbi:hypothetical protein PIB30_043966 [Stylosanthes scabra]|uniref:Uncharacterized protein n=1 Tax=Stylosanthes scabra TaxID=79078 RepID=A0ABU6RGE4_9FABA|nr:hypothetical protein [Stylosanthes scabra]